MADEDQIIILEDGANFIFEATVKGVGELVRGNVAFDPDEINSKFLRVSASSYIPSQPEKDDYAVSAGKFKGPRDLHRLLSVAHREARAAAAQHGEVISIRIPTNDELSL